MDIEVSLKIRSAIKAKLVELGCHVDEELPDYIMVLIANRRTRAHMEEDLQLFLGDNTTAFTAWLHHVLKKLEEITTSGKASIFAAAASSSLTPTPALDENIPSSSQTPDLNEIQASQAKPEKPKKSNEGEKGKVDSSRKKVVIDMKKGRRELAVTKIKLNKNNFDVDNDESLVPVPAKKLDLPKLEKKVGEVRRSKRTLAEAGKSSEDEKCSIVPQDQVTQSSDKQFKIPATSVKKSRKLSRNTDDDLEDCLNLKAEADDLFLDPGAQVKHKSSKATGSNADVEVKELEQLRENVLATRRKRPMERPNQSPKDVNTSDSPPNVKLERDVVHDKSDRKKISPKNMEILSRLIKSNSDVRPARREPRRSDSPKRREHNDVYRQRPSRPSNERDNDDRNNHFTRKRRPDREPEGQKIKQLKSSIGSVITRVTRVPRNMADEEYDPSCPEVNKSNKVQSVIKVPEAVRRRKLSPETQTNKKLLFLAMADAEKSLLQTRQVKSRYEEKESEIESQTGNSSKASRAEKPRKSVHERLGYMSKSKQIADNQDKLLDEWEYPGPAHGDDELENSKYNRFEGDETIIINVPNESNFGRNVIVESKDNFEKIVQRHKGGGEGFSSQLVQPKRISIQVHSDSSSDDDENNNNGISTTTIDYSYKSDDSPSSDRPDDADADVSNDYDILINESNVTLPSPEVDDQNEQEVQDNSQDGFENDGYDSVMNTKKTTITSSNQASRIQITVTNTPPLSPAPALVPPPSTTKTAYSTFSLPQPLQSQSSQAKQQCKFWPNCTFSDKCIYTHPTCKFNTSCTKPNCPYKHTPFFKNPTHQPHIKPSRILAAQGNPGPSGAGTSKICKFFPKCHTLSCTFYHPTPCRFGTGCTDVKCSNYHPGGSVAGKKFAPVKNKMALFKWKAPVSSTTSTIPTVPDFKPDTINSV